MEKWMVCGRFSDVYIGFKDIELELWYMGMEYGTCAIKITLHVK